MDTPGDDHMDYLFKVTIVGDSGVGKTSLLLKYVDDIFSETYLSTIGVDFKIRSFDIDGKKVKLQIWDTAGQDRFKNIVSNFYRNAHGILVVYDVTDMATFKNVQHWLDEIDRYGREECKLVLVGNKTDLLTKREVTQEEASALAVTCSMEYVETSAKTSDKVDELFSHLTRDLMKAFEHPPSAAKAQHLPDGRIINPGGICSC